MGDICDTIRSNVDACIMCGCNQKKHLNQKSLCLYFVFDSRHIITVLPLFLFLSFLLERNQLMYDTLIYCAVQAKTFNRINVCLHVAVLLSVLFGSLCYSFLLKCPRNSSVSQSSAVRSIIRNQHLVSTVYKKQQQQQHQRKKATQSLPKLAVQLRTEIFFIIIIFFTHIFNQNIIIILFIHHEVISCVCACDNVIIQTTHSSVIKFLHLFRNVRSILYIWYGCYLVCLLVGWLLL